MGRMHVRGDRGGPVPGQRMSWWKRGKSSWDVVPGKILPGDSPVNSGARRTLQSCSELASGIPLLDTQRMPRKSLTSLSLAEVIPERGIPEDFPLPGAASGS